MCVDVVSDQPTDAQVRLNPDVTARAAEFCLWNISIRARKVILYAVSQRHGADGFTSPLKEVVLRIFITLKNPSTLVGIEPANLGSSGEHANH
jgi:hypothetical protein